MNDELFEDLCAAMPGEDPEAEEKFAAGGVLATVLSVAVRQWILRQLLKLTCDQKVDILAAVDKFIGERIKNPTLAAILTEVSRAVLETACPTPA
jgi:hypothetical protein